MPSNKRIEEADTEGHMPRVKWVEPAGENDTVDQADEEADTEGHSIKRR
jgi:hypothetical protein